jgi:ribosomal protein S27E
MITKTEITNGAITLTLKNGVTVQLACNPGYLHLSFSGISEGIKATPFAHQQEGLPELKLANYVDIVYKPKEGFYYKPQTSCPHCECTNICHYTAQNDRITVICHLCGYQWIEPTK